MIDGFEPGHDLREPPRRQGQRIAAGQNHFPDCRMLLDIADGGGERIRRKMRPPLGSDHLAAKAEPAIDRTDVQQFQEHAIGVAVDDAVDWAEQKITSRIGHFVWLLRELGQIRNKLAGNWIARIGGVYQRRDGAGYSNRIGCGDLLYRFAFGVRQETGFDEV